MRDETDTAASDEVSREASGDTRERASAAERGVMFEAAPVDGACDDTDGASVAPAWRRALRLTLAAASACVLVVSLVMLAAAPSGWSLSDLFQTTASDGATSTVSGDASATSASASDGSTVAPDDASERGASGADDAGESSVGGNAVGDSAAAGSKNGAGNASGDAAAAAQDGGASKAGAGGSQSDAGVAGTTSDAGSKDGTGSVAGGSSGSGSSAGSASSSSGAGGATAGQGGAAGSGSSFNPAPAPKPATVTVSISVDSSAYNGSVSYSGTLTFEEGATVYDALCGTGLSVNARNTPGMGIYVAAIGGLAEFDGGSGSGWTYRVNGVQPDYTCSKYILKDGDTITWVYVV